MILVKKICFVLSFSLIFASAFAGTPSVNPPADSSIPRVFILGQYDGLPFEKLKANYEASLITACKNDMETAYYCWVHMLKHMESQAGRSGFDLSGIKMWLYVFWEKDGTIGYMAYYLKPNSRNIKGEELTAFLSEFRKNYIFPVKFDKGFSNYSNASFPVMVENPSGGGASVSPQVNTKSSGVTNKD